MNTRATASVAFATAVLSLTFLAASGPIAALTALGAATLTLALIMVGPDRVGSGLLVLALFAAPLDGPYTSVSFVTAFDFLFCVGFFLLLPRLIRTAVRIPRDFLAALFLLAIVSLIAALLAGDTEIGFSRIVRMLTGVGLLPLAILAWNPPRQTISRLALAYTLGQTFSLGYALLGGPGGRFGERLIGLASHPNVFAVCSVMALGLLFYLTSQVTGVLRQSMLAALGLLNLAGLALSGSRGGLLALAVMLLLLPFVERSGRVLYFLSSTATLFIVAMPALLAALGPESALSRLLSPEESSSAAGSSSARGRLLADGVDAFLQHPFAGSGFGGEFTFFYHNAVLEIAVATGILGALAYAAIAASAIRVLFADGPLHRLAYSAVGYFAAGMFVPTVWDRFAWSVIALVLVVHNQRSAGEDADQDLRHHRPGERSSLVLNPTHPGHRRSDPGDDD